MRKIKPNYGLDAPEIIKKFSWIVLVLVCFIILLIFLMPASKGKYLLIISCIITLISFLYPIVAIICGSYFFKFTVRDELINYIPWNGNELVLDVGCGRGLMLIAAAKKLTTGKAIGIDIWNHNDQTQNTQQATRKNAQIEDVANKIEIITTDMRAMPFEDYSFDAVISSWAIHNISDKHERRKALQEIMRVLKPGGSIALADIQCTQEYYDFFKKENCTELKLIGPRYTFGTPTFIVVAKK